MKDLYGVEIKVGSLLMYKSYSAGSLSFGVVNKIESFKQTYGSNQGKQVLALRVGRFYPYYGMDDNLGDSPEVVIVHYLPQVAKDSLKKNKHHFLNIPSYVYES